jgi:DNA-binding CsgD family transcriptional regulator
LSQEQPQDVANKEIIRRLHNLEQHIINLIIPIQEATNLFGNTSNVGALLKLFQEPIKIDDRALSMTLAEFGRKIEEFRDATGKLDIAQTFMEIKYIGKRLNDIEQRLSSMAEEGIRKKIKLELTCDGYEMVKKPAIHDWIEEQHPQKEQENLLHDLLSGLTPLEATVITYRLGLDGGDTRKMTFAHIGKLCKCSAQKVSVNCKRAMRKLRHQSKKHLVDKLDNSDLNLIVYGVRDCQNKD